MTRYLLLLLLAVALAGCHKQAIVSIPPADDHSVDANTARYISTHHCWETDRIEPTINFNAYANKVERSGGRTEYQCDGLEVWVGIDDKESQ